ncbi:hypothetical protein BU15DRAFT_59673 [Melanogaster broomeanus]|nr:hypothetical protein BU15DRAFT_59673 [Melanogaster broomeanus]
MHFNFKCRHDGSGTEVSTFLEMPHVVEVGDITLQQSGMRKYSRCKDLGDGSTIEESGCDDFVVDTGDHSPLRLRIPPFTWGRLLELSLTLHITKDIMDDSLQNIKHCLRLECLHVDIDLSGDFLWHQGQDDEVPNPPLCWMALDAQVRLVDFCAVIGFASELSALSLPRPTGDDIRAIIQGVLEKDSLVVSPLPKRLVLQLTVSTVEQFNDISLAVTNAARASNIDFDGTGFNPVPSGSQSYLELCFPNETSREW